MHEPRPMSNFYDLHSDISDDRRYFHLLCIAVYTELAIPFDPIYCRLESYTN